LYLVNGRSNKIVEAVHLKENFKAFNKALRIFSKPPTAFEVIWKKVSTLGKPLKKNKK